MKQADLLKVLDMSEDFQWNFLVGHKGIQEMCQNQLDAFCQTKHKRRVLADLAFRLRDEVVEKDWVAWQIGSARVWGATHESEYNPGKFGNRAKPIHWIIAALIAKGE